ncbi:MAG: DEAD/DEAH box helicase [Bacteroidales bacterium]|jgi:superfamily II DNA/RNA helicase|nr:DEAD/DEAH box helicase [Bacteroidales bacterium]HOL98006.1 DEAD/DEAH box helicase [Bacteroidales bacterium]HOM36565.1 DEAD/DEAH box helicase [Bacteroidales bacterium]HPD23694.1 DEAD/DEAH box helicase [Bacteroidales bacterium]HRS99809.1 DEAD/DEAH box helicase [Bacteroidales bacterium]
MIFRELFSDNKILEAIESFGYEELTEIQEKVIPSILESKDILACSKTGSGKTAAYILPIIKSLSENFTDGIRAVIICPTREICLQIEEQIAGLAYYYEKISYISIYGGNDQDSFVKQKNALSKGVNIVVATPGRLLSHMALGYINYEKLQFLVLDEADEMLDMGFYEDIMKVLTYLPSRQTLLFSATMPQKIKVLAEKILKEPIIIDLNKSKPADEINQLAYLVYPDNKLKLLFYVLNNYQYKRAIVFASTKTSAGNIYKKLKESKYNVIAIDSSYNQLQRIETIRKFKTRENIILVSTNLLSRGVDIEDVELIINYEIPEKVEDYVHRIGRTARAGKTGLAISLIQPSEFSYFQRIEKFMNKTVEKFSCPEEIGNSPVYEIVRKSKQNYKRRSFKRKNQ